jgi:hypothetical protein
MTRLGCTCQQPEIYKTNQHVINNTKSCLEYCMTGGLLAYNAKGWENEETRQGLVKWSSGQILNVTLRASLHRMTCRICG